MDVANLLQIHSTKTGTKSALAEGYQLDTVKNNCMGSCKTAGQVFYHGRRLWKQHTQIYYSLFRYGSYGS